MAGDHVSSALRSMAAFNERAPDRLVAEFDPECELVPFRAQLEGTSYHGHEAIRRFMRDMDEDWTRFTIAPQRVGQSGDRVVLTGRVTGSGRASGVDLDLVAGFVFEFRGELIVQVRSYSDPDEAVRVSGLEVKPIEEAE
jgi:ketosteroid isomerase-like protein